MIVRACSVLLGIIFLFAGTGKVLGNPDFVLALEKTIPLEIANVIASYLPWIEVILGLLFVFGLLPLITSVFSLVLISGFIASNLWSIVEGGASIRCGDCFGVWESLLGSPSAVEALTIDLIMLGIAVAVLIMYKK